VDKHLISDIHEYAERHPGLEFLDANAAELLRKEVGRRFAFPENHRWWWQTVPSAARIVSYAEGEGLKKLRAMVGAQTGHVCLFVTDDEDPPWPCVKGSIEDAITMVGEQRFFEYAIVDINMTWIVFDTHMNTLVYVTQRG